MKTNSDDSPSSGSLTVRHNVAAGRYEVDLPGELAVVEYERRGSRIVFTHTFVPPEHRGGGLAAKLVRRALDDARAQRVQVVPACSYVAAFIGRHPEYQPLLEGTEPG